MLASGPESVGRLSVSLESGVHAGTVTILVDDKPTFRASLVTPAPTQRALIFRTESGGYQGTLPIATGERYVRVEITGAAPARVETIAGTFGPGRSRHLYVVVGMSEDPLSLAWRAGARPQTVDEPER